ncbi:hypothetical protein [Nodularia chucula]|uniref:hypothetical protein n=1 Tax=Nodularia chucula TaxID=3093667 RepID=UPI0039C74577
MNNKLRFELITKPHPYLNEKSSMFEEWGDIKILILFENKKLILLKTEWNMLEIVKWVIKNQHNFCNSIENIHEEIQVFANESLAKSLERLHQKDFYEEEDSQDKWYEALYKFREQHNLRFAMRGSNIPDIVIGLNKGKGEISLYNEEHDWSYSFDIEDFLNNFIGNYRHMA